MEHPQSPLPNPDDTSSKKPLDPDDHIHSNPPTAAPSNDPDDLVRTFPPNPELTGLEDPDDLLHPPTDIDPDEKK